MSFTVASKRALGVLAGASIRNLKQRRMALQQTASSV